MPTTSSTLPRVHIRLTGACVAVTGLLLAGCAAGSAFNPSTSSSTGSSAGSSAEAGAAGSSPATTPADRPACTADDITVQGAFGAKPSVTIPDTCAPPAKLVTKDLSAGTGAVVKEGDTVRTDYLLVTWSDKQVLDTSFGRQPFPVQNVGHAQVIDGWNQGLIGMKQGGRRLLIVPPELGYGQGGNGIQPNETLVFVIDAVTVTS
jgi:peptidylprolyl isomerase